MLKPSIALLISILIVGVITNFVLNALSSFYSYKNISAPKMELTLDRFHFFLKNELKKEWLNITVSKPLKDESSPLKTFRITVDKEDINKLNVDLPRSGKEQYVDAYLNVSDEKNVKKIKLRYRGDTSLHWLYKQKSLRIKLLENKTYNLHKKFNLVNPITLDIVMDVVNYKLASREGLISPEYYPARVFINSEYHGVYMFLSQPDESLLRMHKIMPGSIYFGDSGNDLNKDGVSDLWWNPKFWEKKSSRNAEQKTNREDIDSFISIISKASDLNFFDKFNTVFDKKKFYDFFSLDVLFGSYHHDFAHNHKLYFDPYKGKFEPIAWDQRRWSPRNFKDTSNYLLLEKIKLNPILEYERDLNTYELFLKYNFEYINKMLDTYSQMQYADLASDKYRDTGVSVANSKGYQFTSASFSMEQYESSINGLKNTYKTRRVFLENIFNDSELEYVIEKYNDYLKATFYVNGNSPVILSNKLANICMDSNFNGKSDDSCRKNTEIILYPGRVFKDGNAINLHSYGFGKRYLVPSRQRYVLFIKSNNIDMHKFDFKNAITGKSVSPKLLELHPKVKLDSIHAWKLPQPKNKTIVLNGRLNITETRVYDKYTTVIIKPGTIFSMSKNASIYFYGKINAIGTKEKPIKFIAKDKKIPWGIVAVQGKSTTGSKFEYVEIENGSVDTRNLLHYTAQFNIHDTEWFEVRHCKIGPNFIGDDSMHIAYAKGVVENSVFYAARSDGLDIDISNVSITNNVFHKSGNDGLDVMTTVLNASNNLFIDSGDKGISVGEWSEAHIVDSVFLRGRIGLEVKDKSKVKANNLIFVDSEAKSINLYNKNKRYDEGGFIEGDMIFLLGNLKINADKYSGETIEHIFKNHLPQLDKFQWHQNFNNTPYLDDIKAAVLKYDK